MNRLQRGAVLALFVTMLVSAAQACRIPDIRPWPVPPPERPVPRVDPILTTSHKAEIEIRENVARVEVSATFHNPNRFRVEGTYFFPIDVDAVVKDFAMTVNGKTLKAELLDADRARQIYEEIVRKQKDPGLLEYVGTRMLKARVFPIEPDSDVAITLVYQQVVKADGGLLHFRYPLRSAMPNTGKIKDLSLRVAASSETPVKLFYSPSHKIDVVRKEAGRAVGGFELSDVVPEKDFELYWSLDRADVDVAVAAYRPKGEDGFCMISLAPKVELKRGEAEAKDIVFVFDKSGSMAGDKIRQAQDALDYCLKRLNPQDRFAVMFFSTEAEDLTGGLQDATPEAVAAACDQAGKVEARGGTAIHEALSRSCALLTDSDRLAMVIFLTDGKPTIGPVDIEEILAAAGKGGARTRARVFVFGVGNDVNTDLLDRMATELRGSQDYVGEKEDIEVKVSNFYEKIAHPVLSDVSIEAQGFALKDVYPRQVPDLFRGGQTLLFGRYSGEGTGQILVRGKAGGKDHAFECEVQLAGSEAHAFMAPIWAHRKVAFLLEQIRVHGKEKELVDEVVALGKQYGIMTPYNSLLIVEDDPVAAPIARGIQGRFEKRKDGPDGVGWSRNLAKLKSAAVAPASAEAGRLGMGGGDSAPMSEADRSLERLVLQRVQRVADKVFYRQQDGVYYDAAFEEQAREDIVEIKRFSRAYFDLLTRHRGIGKYLAAAIDMVICVDGGVYRIVD